MFTLKYCLDFQTSKSLLYIGYTQKNGAVSKVNKKFISHLTRVQLYTVSSGNCPNFACATSSSLLMLTAGRARFRKDAPHRNNITRRYRQFVEIGCLCQGKSPGRPRGYDDNIERVREAFQRSTRKSVARASRGLDMQKITVWKVLRKRLHRYRTRCDWCRPLHQQTK